MSVVFVAAVETLGIAAAFRKMRSGSLKTLPKVSLFSFQIVAEKLFQLVKRNFIGLVI